MPTCLNSFSVFTLNKIFVCDRLRFVRVHTETLASVWMAFQMKTGIGLESSKMNSQIDFLLSTFCPAIMFE